MWAQDAAVGGAAAGLLDEAASARSRLGRRLNLLQGCTCAISHSMPTERALILRPSIDLAAEVDPVLLIRLCVHDGRALTLAVPRG